MKIDKAEYRILVVEDNPGDFYLVDDYLKEHIQKPILTQAKDFKQLESMNMDQSFDYDIVLLDLSLPDINKEKLTEYFKPLFVKFPVIILTGYSDLEFSTKALSSGFSDYLVKDTITSLILYKSILYAIERHRFINSLRESEKRYMDLFHMSPAPMYVFDVKTLEFLDANEALISNYGYSKEELLSMDIKQIRPEEDIPLLENAIEETKDIGKHYFQKVFRHRKKDGTIIYVEIIKNPLEFNGRQASIILATDVTDKIEYIKAIQDQNAKLKEIAWTQSHIVRAPVARLMGLIDMFKSGNLDENEKSLFLDHILTTAKEVDEIISDIVVKSQLVMDFSKTYDNQVLFPKFPENKS
ncbi:PAS domain S-box protein [Leptospira sp. 96542]|nr:PAS domain S-box protein [Leptospira sp. 96542]